MPDSAEVQVITRRHYEWVTVVRQGRRRSAKEFAGGSVKCMSPTNVSESTTTGTERERQSWFVTR